jgi:hypothetical protein
VGGVGGGVAAQSLPPSLLLPSLSESTHGGTHLRPQGPREYTHALTLRLLRALFNLRALLRAYRLGTRRFGDRYPPKPPNPSQTHLGPSSASRSSVLHPAGRQSFGTKGGNPGCAAGAAAVAAQ